MIRAKFPILAISLLFSACASQPATEHTNGADASTPIATEPSTAKKSNPATDSKAPAGSQQDKVAVNNKAAEKAVAKKSNLSDEVLFYLMVAEIAGQRGQIDAAIDNYVAAAMISRDLQVVERAARIAVYARDDVALSKVGNLWAELAAKDAEAHQILAALQVRKGNADKALFHFDKVLQYSKQGKHKSFMLITTLLGKEKDKKFALEVMQRLAEKYPNNASAFYGLANLSFLVNELESADSAVQQAISLKPDWTEAYILRVNILDRQQKPEQAMDVIVKALDKHPDNTRLRLFYARKLVDNKQLSLSYDQFNQVYQDSPNNLDALYALGLISFQLKQYELSTNHFNKLLELNSRTDEANFYLGEIAEREKDFAKAVKHYSASHKGRYLFESQLRIAIITGQQGKVTAARDRLQNINAVKRDDKIRLIVVEGEILRENKMYQQAFALYSKALLTLKDSVQIIYARALMADKVDRLDVTISDLKHVIKLEPKNAQALNALGYTLVDQTDKLEEGLKYIQQAYALKPDDPAIIDSLGWALYRSGQIDEALPHLQRAFELFNDAEIAAHLGEVLWVKGDREQAIEVWDSALKAKPEHEALRDTMKRFIK